MSNRKVYLLAGAAQILFLFIAFAAHAEDMNERMRASIKVVNTMFENKGSVFFDKMVKIDANNGVGRSRIQSRRVRGVKLGGAPHGSRFNTSRLVNAIVTEVDLGIIRPPKHLNLDTTITTIIFGETSVEDMRSVLKLARHSGSVQATIYYIGERELNHTTLEMENIYYEGEISFGNPECYTEATC